MNSKYYTVIRWIGVVAVLWVGMMIGEVRSELRKTTATVEGPRYEFIRGDGPLTRPTLWRCDLETGAVEWLQYNYHEHEWAVRTAPAPEGFGEGAAERDTVSPRTSSRFRWEDFETP